MTENAGTVAEIETPVPAEVVAEPVVPEPTAAPFDHTTEPTALAIVDEPAATPAPTPAPEVTEAPAATEPPKPEGTEPPAATPEPTPAPTEAPVNYEFKFPEGFTPDQTMVAGAVEVFRELKIPPEAAQKLVDQHIAAMSAFVQSQPEQWHKAFLDTRKAWQVEAQADPVIGGAAWNTSVAAANAVLANTAIVPKSEREAFTKMLRDTGVGDHPQFIKAMVRINTFFTEPAAPPPAQVPPPRNGAASGSRRSAVLDHPTSHQTR
jgi:hypothetical protein